MLPMEIDHTHTAVMTIIDHVVGLGGTDKGRARAYRSIGLELLHLAAGMNEECMSEKASEAGGWV